MAICLGESTPRAVAGATDLTTGGRMFFEQGMFDIICADLTKFPLSRAAAASSAVPVVLSPVALDNRGGTCGYQPPPWLTELLKSPEGQHFGNRLAIRARQALQLEDGSARPYIHLVDGGLADNLALLGLVQFLQGFMDDAALRAALDIGSWRRIAIIIVNAQDAPNFDYDKLLDGPGAIPLLAQSVSVPMDRLFERVHRRTTGHDHRVAAARAPRSRCAAPGTRHRVQCRTARNRVHCGRS